MPDNEAYLLAATKPTSWNKGKLIGAKPPLRPKHVWVVGSGAAELHDWTIRGRKV